MKNNFDECLGIILKHEGGWSDHPSDPGGATMKGVTLETYSRHIGRQASKDELRNIPYEHLRDIYKNKFWNLCKCDDLPLGLDLCVFDMAVNSGPSRAAKMLQSVVGTTPDGAIGPKTIEAVLSKANTNSVAFLIEQFQKARQHYLESLPTFPTFGKGWTRRVSETCDLALKMANS